MEVADWFPHHEYDKVTGEHDVAILKVKHPIDLVAPDTFSKLDRIPEDGQRTSVFLSFGRTQDGSFPDRIIKVSVGVVPHDRFNARDFYDGKIYDDIMVCACRCRGLRQRRLRWRQCGA